MIYRSIMILFLFFSSCASAANLFDLNSSSPLPMAQAYHFSATRSGETIVAHWSMAEGYYLYQDRFCFKLNNQVVQNIQLPPAVLLKDDVLGSFKVYQDQVDISLAVPAQYANQPVQLGVCYQGCSSGHFCYPPAKETMTLSPDAKTLTKPTQKITSRAGGVSQQDHLTWLLASDHLWLAFLSFWVIGLLLTFTPCVLPMIPILSSLVIGHEGLSTVRAAWISLTYVLSMAFTYAGVGVIAGLAGANLQTVLQAPLAIVFMSLLFVLLALSLFGLYEIRLPERLQMKLTTISNHQKAGSFLGAALMGCLATLIVSPCVSPALIAAVTYIAQTGNAFLGGAALFTMALGMGFPLLLVGIFGGRILPRTGHWMETVKQVMGVLMLMVAILLLSRIIPHRVSLFLWSALLIVSSIYLGLLQPALTGWARFWKGLGLLLAILGGILLVSAVHGKSALQLSTLDNAEAGTNSTLFRVVTTPAALDEILAEAKKQHKMVMLDFYAKWCLSCKEMDIRTFRDSAVVSALQRFVRVRIDVTANTAETKVLEKQYGVVAPPTMIFLDTNGQEIPGQRIVGGLGPKAFLEQVQKILDLTPGS